MTKGKTIPQKTARHDWHPTLYAYHEAGHAVVGHVIGRCISDISIVADKSRVYKGYCEFSHLAEDANYLPQWGPGRPNPERITVMFAGTVAMEIICEERGWDYDRWRGSDMGDLATICLWSVEMVGEEVDKQHALQRACKWQAYDILEHYWGAVEALAAVLERRGRMRGGEAHRIIQDAIAPTSTDWRMATGTEERVFSDSDGI